MNKKIVKLFFELCFIFVFPLILLACTFKINKVYDSNNNEIERNLEFNNIFEYSDDNINYVNSDNYNYIKIYPDFENEDVNTFYFFESYDDFNDVWSLKDVKFNNYFKSKISYFSDYSNKLEFPLEEFSEYLNTNISFVYKDYLDTLIYLDLYLFYGITNDGFGYHLFFFDRNDIIQGWNYDSENSHLLVNVESDILDPILIDYVNISNYNDYAFIYDSNYNFWFNFDKFTDESDWIWYYQSYYDILTDDFNLQGLEYVDVEYKYIDYDILSINQNPINKVLNYLYNSLGIINNWILQFIVIYTLLWLIMWFIYHLLYLPLDFLAKILINKVDY